MLAARTSSSGPGNGDHQWLNKLISDVQKLTHELQELTGRIELVDEPAQGDIAKAHELVGRLLALIKEQIMPRQAKLREMASASGPAPNLDQALRSLHQSGRDALSAIVVYKNTLGNEQRQRQNERRSNTRYAADQRSLQKLRYEASDKVGYLLSASQGFLRFITL